MRVHAVCNSIAITASEPGGISRCVEWRSEQGGTGWWRDNNTEAAEALEAATSTAATTITRGGRNAPKAQLEKQSTKQRFEFRSKRFHRHLLLTRWRSRYTMDLCAPLDLYSNRHTTPPPPQSVTPVAVGTATEVECN